MHIKSGHIIQTSFIETESERKKKRKSICSIIFEVAFFSRAFVCVSLSELGLEKKRALMIGIIGVPKEEWNVSSSEMARAK